MSSSQINTVALSCPEICTFSLKSEMFCCSAVAATRLLFISYRKRVFGKVSEIEFSIFVETKCTCLASETSSDNRWAQNDCGRASAQVSNLPGDLFYQRGAMSAARLMLQSRAGTPFF